MSSKKTSGSRAKPVRSVFDATVPVEQYSLENLKMLARNSDIQGRSSLANAKQYYNALSGAFKAGQYKAGSNLKLKGSKLSQYDRSLSDDYYTLKQLKGFAKDLNIPNRTGLRSKVALRQALNAFSGKTSPGTMARLVSRKTQFQPLLGLDAYTKDELYLLGKTMGAKRNMNKQALWDILSGKVSIKSPVKGGVQNMTVAELRAHAKSLGLTGYSRLKRDELVALIGRGKSSPSQKKSSGRKLSGTGYAGMNVAALKKLASQRMITGYGKMKRAELEQRLLSYNSQKKSSPRNK